MIKKSLKKAIHFSGINFLSRKILTNYPRIIMLHNISSSVSNGENGLTTEAFRLYLEHIKSHYNPMTVSELVKSKDESGRYAKKAVAITFDDGYNCFYDRAFPLLQEFEIPATIFVVPDLIEHEPWIWPDKVSYIYNKSQELFTGKSKEELLAGLKKLSSLERNKCIDEFIESSALVMPEIIPDDCREVRNGVVSVPDNW